MQWDPNLTLLAIAGLNCFTAFMAWNTHKLTKQVEVATNSMKDALVKATGEASHAAGREEGRIAGEVKAANLAEGALIHTDIGIDRRSAPVPVADDRTAVAAERSATATERVADVAETNSAKKEK